MRQILVLPLLVAALPTLAATGPKPCDELKQEIAAKIDARGVKRYTLEIVAPDAIAEHKVVGSCEGGSKRVVYQRLPVEVPASTPALAGRAQ